MTGGLIHLAYIGNQEKYLTHLPSITFFKTAYCKYSHFAIQDHYIQSETDINFGSKTHYKIRHYADLVFRPYLRIAIPSIEASYIDSIESYLVRFNAIKRITNTNANLVMTKLSNILNNYKNTNRPVYINNNNVIMHSYNSSYDDVDYSHLIDISMNNSYDYSQYYDTTIVPNNNVNRLIYYSSYNIKYLTEALTKLNFDNETIITGIEYFNEFKKNLIDYVIKLDENKFMYSVINNQQLFTYDLSSKNTITNYTNELTYSMQYFYTNMKLLYIYNKDKQLKSIYNVEDYSYSGGNYTNKVRVVENLYPYLNSIITDVSTSLFISNGHNMNKNISITKINSISKVGFMYYDISLNTDIVEKDPNKLYMIYGDNLPRNEGINRDNTEEAGIEDYYDIYFNGPSKNKYYNIYPDIAFKLPICYVKYNLALDLFENVEFATEITNEDFVFLYKDVVVFDEESQHYSFVLINNAMYELTETVTDTQYTNNLYIRNKVDVIDETINYNGNMSFLLSSDNDTLKFVNNYTSQQYHTQNYITPYVINLTLESDMRLIPIEMVATLNLNLDSYNNLLYVKDEIGELNKTSQEKTSIIYSNVTNCVENHMLYVNNIFDTLFNNRTYYKFYNNFSYTNNSSSLNLNLSPKYLTNIGNNMFSNGNINGEKSYYNALQNVIATELDKFLDVTDSIYNTTIRHIMDMNSEDKTAFVNTLNNIYNNDAYLYLIGVSTSATYAYTDEDTSIESCKIYFEINNDFMDNNILIDLSENFNFVLPTESDFYYVPDMFIKEEILASSSHVLHLTPLNGVSNKLFYVLNALLNTNKDANGNYIVEKLYILPGDKESTDVTMSEQQVILDKSNDSKNTYLIYDNLLNDESKYFFDVLDDLTNGKKNKAIDIQYILYHYSTLLYRDVRERTSALHNTNKYTQFNDYKMYESLRHIKQSIYKKFKNGNQILTDLATLTTSSSYFLDYNVCFQDHIDSATINNSLQQSFTQYTTAFIRPLIIALLKGKTNYFNFYKQAYDLTFTDTSNNSSLDINLSLINNFKLLQWYYHFLNSVKSDINDYVVNDSGIEIITGITTKQITSLNTFFDVSTNVFNPTYKGSVFSIDISDYGIILSINDHINDILTHIKEMIKDRNITLNDGSIVIYSDENIKQIYTTVMFDTLPFYDLITNGIKVYTDDIELNYEYNNILSMFVEFKTEYLKFYDNILVNVTAFSSFTSTYMNKYKQILNFDLADYEGQMNWFKINPNYLPINDIHKFKTSSGIITDETYYKYSLVNNKTIGDAFYATTSATYIALKDSFFNNQYLLDILYMSLQELIDKFNSYFNYNYLFYSDYRIIYALYFYYYKTYTFTHDEKSYTLYFDTENNTATTNKITNNDDLDEEYLYSYIVFAINNDIRYKLINNKFYDLSENTYINYNHNYNNNQHSIKRYDENYTYSIINNYIVDLSENTQFIIKHDLIYDLSSNNVGSFNGDTYNISDTIYKYELTNTRVRALFPNYTNVEIIDNNVEINNKLYNIKNNVFHDTSNNLTFEFIIPKINTKLSSPEFRLLHNDEQISLIPSTLQSYSDTHHASTVISTVFTDTFNSTNIEKSVEYLQEAVIDEMYDISGIKPHNIEKLLSLSLSNSIIPQGQYVDDTILCANFNNQKDDGADITNMILYLQKYNVQNINPINIFNVTDQKLHNLSQFAQVAGKTFYFIPHRDTYIPTPNADSVTNFTDKYNHTIDNMLLQASIVKNLNMFEDVSNNKYNVNLVKNYIMQEMLVDISNNTITDFYGDNVYFDISYGIVTWNNDDNHTNDSYFIKNFTLLSNDNQNNMLCLENENYSLVFDKSKYYLTDVSDNKYEITLSTNVVEDISYNDCYFKFGTNSVIVDVSASIFPKMLNILQGKIYRYDAVDHGYEIDNCGNLLYTFKYDKDVDILLKVSENINNIDISCTMIEDYDDLSNNYLGDQLAMWNNNVILDTDNHYCHIDTSLNMKNKHIIMDDGTTTYLGFITYTIINDNDQQIAKIYFHDSFVLDNSKTYTIKTNIESFLSKLSMDKLWYRTIFYYWETFSKSLESIKTLMETYDDTKFNNEKFTRNTFTENIFGEINNKVPELLETCVEVFENQMVYNVNTFGRHELVETLKSNLHTVYKEYTKNANIIYFATKRDPVPKCSWIDYLGHYICDNVAFSIDGNVIEDINDHTIQHYNLRQTNDGTIDTLYKMIGHNCELQIPQNKIQKNTIHVPLPMCFEHNTKALPLIAMMNSDMTMEIKLKSLDQLIKTIPGVSIKSKGRIKIDLGLSYVYLAQDAREKFARSRHEYVYDIKRYMKHTVDSNNSEIKLEIENPCKEMQWLYMDQKIYDKKDYWNYTAKPYKIYSPDLVYDNVYEEDDVKEYIKSLLKPMEQYHNLDLTTKLQVTALNKYQTEQVVNYIKRRPTNPNPFTRTTLDYSGHNRFDMVGEQSGLVDPLLHYKDTFAPGINVRSWSRTPKEILHMGYNNYSLCHDMRLGYEMNVDVVDGEIIIMWSEYNLLRIASGIASKMW